MAFVVFVGFVFRSVHRAPFAGRRTRAMLFLTMTDPVALLALQRGELSTAHGEQVVA